MTRGALQARQTATLVWKNIIIVLFRHAFSTPLRCFLLPVIFIGFLAYARNVCCPPNPRVFFVPVDSFPPAASVIEWHYVMESTIIILCIIC